MTDIAIYVSPLRRAYGNLVVVQHAYDPGVSGAAISPQDLGLLAAWGVVGLRLSARFLRQKKAGG